MLVGQLTLPAAHVAGLTNKASICERRMARIASLSSSRAVSPSVSLRRSQVSASRARAAVCHAVSKQEKLGSLKNKQEEADVVISSEISDMSFWQKVKTAMRIFFPPKEEDNARVEAKKRLRMILVADRCAMSPASMNNMKESIVGVVSEYVEVEEEDSVDLSVTTDPDLGTIYSVSVPVKRVKPAFIGAAAEDQEALRGELADGIEFEWEGDDSDPSARFPFGT